jgi:capsular exopolysaccharide synthesis family protein
VFRSKPAISRRPESRADLPPVLDGVIDHIYRMKVLLNGASGRGGFAVACSSCAHGQGASTVALNFALAVARSSDERCLLLDANVRSPSLHHCFEVPLSPGFSDYLSGAVGLEDILHERDNVYFIAAGGQPVSPATQLDQPSTTEALDSLRKRFRFIIVDTAPIAPYPETAIVARRLDGALMVLAAEETRWEVARHARELLRAAGVEVLGAVLNRKKRFIPERLYRLL